MSNTVSHKASAKLKTVRANRPFDIVCFDTWRPGNIPSKGSRGTPPVKGLLIRADVMTTFAGIAEACRIDSEDVSRATVMRFFTAFGMPLLVLINDGSEFKDVLVKTCKLLVLACHVVTEGNHKAVVCERFH